jgi:hypothetical protein
MRIPLILLAAAAAVGQAAPLPATPVIVELFTSEGCSSCPPADDALQRLEAGVPHAEVIALGEHVTYWDRLGWKDRFSADVFTKRQEDYARRFRLASVYTPQMVVNGQAEFVGVDEGRARKEIAKAAQEPGGRLTLTIDHDVVAIRAMGLPPEAKGADVILAVTETRLDTDVQRGENSGHKLRHTGVVRSLESIGRIEDSRSGSYANQSQVRIDPSWKRENLKLVVFLQDRVTKRIWAVSAAKL